MSLVYVHIGNTLPEYIFDSIYQTLLLCHSETKIYVILDDTLLSSFQNTLEQFNLNIFFKTNCYSNSVVQTIPTSILTKELESNENFCSYQNIMKTKFSNLVPFRDGFWMSTTSRFFYIEAFMNLFKIRNLFHIENDIMLYENIKTLADGMLDKICMVKDAPERVIPSILFFPSHESIQQLNGSIVSQLEQSSEFLNDMTLLGKYTNCHYLPIFPMQSTTIFDGAAIGQYLGGIDYKNLSEVNDITMYANPSRGFINETSVFNPNTCNYLRSPILTKHSELPIKIYRCEYKNNLYNIANLHIHSKQLYQFSSVFNINFENLISGDRVGSLCDFVILTRDILQYHKNIDKFAKDIIIINDIHNMKMTLLNQYFLEFCIKNRTKHIKLFLYTHMLTDFQTYIAKNLNSDITYTLYIHNSDHSFNDSHHALLELPYIKHIFAQNIDYSQMNNKLTLLPIGIANSMWPHGDLLTLYSVMRKTYFKKKSKNIYVNINPNTYGYRAVLLETLKKAEFTMSASKAYKDYLEELSQHWFCLCVRGNGLDTHRFWEALYLGTIPVVINNSETRLNNFVKYLKELEVPFVEINNVTKYTQDYFVEELYKKQLKLINNSIQNLKHLRLDAY